MAANFRAERRARSQREHYAKLCIVVEEADETLFWLEMLKDSGLESNQNQNIMIYKQMQEIVRIMSSTKKKLGLKIKSYAK